MMKNSGRVEAPSTLPAATFLADGNYLAELRERMLKFATLQLSDVSLAEDAVQEALAGALRNAGAFAGRSAFRTWVFAILRNKIADQLRFKRRQATIVPLPSPASDDVAPAFFDIRRHWLPEHAPSDWGNPEAELLGKDFWRVFETCLDHLPPDQSRVFMMREFVDMQTPEICAEVGISISNLHVLMHRARLRLRNCLEGHWFAPKETC
ncbi:RNA polymerase, sigma-24 subunit, ECF subfamily [Rhizobium sp. PDO1-076]|uniref:sigma-70 family RNA polymerase sigma factor n=1 Tax=Rhizobium sp. PDO1-076 TaxID=1125979 RepID=UPI00024E3CC1|nr:sigma-70 family RNA polymerase sigma factor [Rhizobium sp. PDO1-076]EHS51311.1 RNA polymerase, sigma-24 subunit, ECF subfamily [Rhizobium sp. PDO1-076]